MIALHMSELKHWSDSEYNVVKRPSVVQSAEYEKLGKSVCRDAKDRPDDVYDEQARGLVGEKPASDLKGAMATQETPKIVRQESRTKCRGVSMGLDETHP